MSRKMKAVILGGGYGTRLQRDLLSDTTGVYDALRGVPKPLLPIGPCPLITHWMKMLNATPEVTEVIVITNSTNHSAFEKWAQDWPGVTLVCDGSTSNETRSGAVACMNLAAKRSKGEDIIIIAGDTLFYEDFSLQEVIKSHQKFQELQPDGSTLVYVSCSDDEVHKYGILETDSDLRVTGFLEKPQPDQTTSRKECPCFYLLSKSALPLLGQFLEEKKDEPLKARDATGNFIAYLYQRMPVFATEISGRFDVGGLQSYLVCHEYFLKKEKSAAT